MREQRQITAHALHKHLLKKNKKDVVEMEGNSVDAP